MLQGRLFSYGDAQRYRLGVNHHLIPVNKARCPFHSCHRTDEDYSSQPGALFRLMTADKGKLLFENTGRALGDAPMEVKLRHLCNSHQAGPAYAAGVAKVLKIAWKAPK
jgi:catalase